MFGAVMCWFGAAALYGASKENERNEGLLRSSTRVDQLKDLPQLFDDAASKVLPSVVVVSGTVGSDTPITRDYNNKKGLQCVILEETVKQHYLERDDADEKWKEKSSIVLHTRQHVPWYLDDGTGRVHVVADSSDAHPLLRVGSKSFEPSACSSPALDDLSKLKMLGVTRIEHVLPIGEPLTVVGEALKNGTGSIQIHRPHNGPFYVTRTNIDKLIADLHGGSSICKYASICLALFGIFFVVEAGIEFIMEKRRVSGKCKGDDKADQGSDSLLTPD